MQTRPRRGRIHQRGKARTRPSARNAVSCDASPHNAEYARVIPSARTATTATVKSSTGGICQARVITHAAARQGQGTTQR